MLNVSVHRLAAFWLALLPVALLMPASSLADSLADSLTDSPAGDEPSVTPFISKLNHAAAHDDFVGLAVAIVTREGTQWSGTYGVTDIQAGAAIRQDTVFRVASLSKGFAASLAGLSVSEGELSLAAPVDPLVPQFELISPSQESALTVEHILSHRVGLPPNAYDNLLEANIDPLEILARYAGVEMICGVGQCYAYQNVAFNMISNVLEQVARQDFADLLEQRLFAPLAMEQASLGREALMASSSWARPHVRRTRTQWVPVDVKQSYYNLPASSGINASIADMAIWVQAQLGVFPEVLPEEVLKKIHEPRVASRSETRRWRRLGNRVRSTHYGLGWRIYDYAGERLVTHSGSVEGYMAQIAFLPEHGVGIVILANARALRAWRILPTFLDQWLGLPEEDWLQLNSPDAP